MLLGLLAPLGLLKVVFSDTELIRYKNEIESITAGDAFTSIVGELVKRDEMIVKVDPSVETIIH